MRPLTAAEKEESQREHSRREGDYLKHCFNKGNPLTQQQREALEAHDPGYVDWFLQFVVRRYP